MSQNELFKKAKEDGLYDPRFEHDNCGIGAVVNIKGVKSHATVENALKIVENLEHRAGKDAEGKTGDGVGILLQISHKFFKKVTKSLGFEIGGEREYGVGMFFMPQDELKRKREMKMFEIITEKEGLEFFLNIVIYCIESQICTLFNHLNLVRRNILSKESASSFRESWCVLRP